MKRRPSRFRHSTKPFIKNSSMDAMSESLATNRSILNEELRTKRTISDSASTSWSWSQDRDDRPVGFSASRLNSNVPLRLPTAHSSDRQRTIFLNDFAKLLSAQAASSISQDPRPQRPSRSLLRDGSQRLRCSFEGAPFIDFCLRCHDFCRSSTAVQPMVVRECC